MKLFLLTTLFLLSCTAQVPEARRFEKTFQAIMPCEDCHGIYTLLVIRPNDEFRLERKYLGRSETIEVQTGTFNFLATENMISLPLSNNETLSFKVDDASLYPLDENQQKLKLKNNQELEFEELTLTNGTFWLEGMNGEKISTDSSEKAWIAFEDSQLTGYSSCNTLRGRFEFDSKTQMLLISDTATSKKFCPGNQIETLLLDTLANVAKYELRDDLLNLMDLHDKTLLQFKAGPMR